MSEISKKAMLVDLSISQLTRTKTDRTLTAESTAAHGADNRSIRVIKQLFDATAISECNSIIRQCQNIHSALTLPWNRDGMGILATKNFNEYSTKMRPLLEELQVAAQKLANKRAEALSKAHAKLGTAFNEDDYPTTEEIATSYKVKISFYPVPTVGDFRCELTADDMAVVRAEIEANMNSSMAGATKALVGTLLDGLTHVTDRIYAGDITKAGVESMLKKVEAAIKVNVNDDSKLEKLINETRQLFASADATTLRENASVSEDLLDKVDEIAAELEEYAGIL